MIQSSSDPLTEHILSFLESRSAQKVLAGTGFSAEEFMGEVFLYLRDHLRPDIRDLKKFVWVNSRLHLMNCRKRELGLRIVKKREVSQ